MNNREPHCPDVPTSHSPGKPDLPPRAMKMRELTMNFAISFAEKGTPITKLSWSHESTWYNTMNMHEWHLCSTSRTSDMSKKNHPKRSIVSQGATAKCNKEWKGNKSCLARRRNTSYKSTKDWPICGCFCFFPCCSHTTLTSRNKSYPLVI